jgi:glycosyltransferase involved in cell wall biosynthesis
MAMGKAIVATPLSTDGLAVENNVHVELAETAEEFTAHVVDLLNSPARRRVLGEEARGLVEREHSLEALGRRFISVLEAASRSVPA